MRIIITKDYDELSKKAAEIIIGIVKNKPTAVLGLATGTTPLGLYGELKADRDKNGTDYSKVRAVNLDEYAGLGADNKNSYAHFMRENLFNGLNIDLKNTYIENGAAADGAAECKRYDALLESLPRDIQLLGIGSNGHIAFNEPGTPFGATTHTVELAASTVKDNSRLFDSIDDVPRKAYTMGLKSIMQSRSILVLATGANKAEAVKNLVNGKITEDVPASVLQLHPDCTLICDSAAAALL